MSVGNAIEIAAKIDIRRSGAMHQQADVLGCSRLSADCDVSHVSFCIRTPYAAR
jgi:hypothetical protein